MGGGKKSISRKFTGRTYFAIRKTEPFVIEFGVVKTCCINQTTGRSRGEVSAPLPHGLLRGKQKQANTIYLVRYGQVATPLPAPFTKILDPQMHTSETIFLSLYISIILNFFLKTGRTIKANFIVIV